MASIQVRHNRHGKRRYRVQIRCKGVCVSKTFGNRREGERWARAMEDRAELDGSSPATQAAARTVAEMIDRYCREVLPEKAVNTQKIQHGQLMFWRNYLGDRKLCQVSSAEIADAKAELAPRANATINCYLAALGHCFTMAMKEWRWLGANPVMNVTRKPLPKSRTRMLTDAERARLIFYARQSIPELETIITVALSTGARKMEIMGMKFSDYHRQTGRVILHETKNKERRMVRLFGEAARRMAEIYDRRRPGQLLFFPGRENPCKPLDFRHAWEQCLEKAEIPDFCFHDLRHSAASYLAAHGATLADIKEILGHKSIQTTQKYTHLTESHTEALVQRMNLAIF